MHTKANNRQLQCLKWLKIIIISILCLNFLVTLFSHSKPRSGIYQDGETPRSGTLYLTNDQQQTTTSLVLKTDVDMVISGLTARVKVSQKFRNELDQWVEGKYLFPLPEKAAVDHLTMKVGERLIIGEIQEKQQAKRTYQKAKISGKKASLVEQHRPNLFTNSVANIAPYETVEVIIEYQQDVAYHREEGFSIRFPMAITPRYQPKNIIRESFDDSQHMSMPFSPVGQGFINQVSQIKMLFPEADENQLRSSDNLVDLKIRLNAGIPLQQLSSKTHEIYNEQKSENDFAIRFAHTQVKADHDFVLNWKPIASQKPRAAVFTEKKAGENYVSLMVMPPSVESINENQDSGADSIRREIIFVIDTSGSMGGESIRQAKSALEFALTTLSPDDTFNVVQFNSVTNKLFSNARLATQHNVQRANSYINRLKAGGGTEMFAAIEASLDAIEAHSSLRQVIFLTDGAISNESQLFKLITERLGDSRLYTVGIGSAPNEFFMKKAARFGRGTATFIADITQSRIKMEKLFESVSQPQLTHIDIQWPDAVKSETWPDKIPDLYDGYPLWIKSKVSDLAGKVEITGRLNETLWQSQLPLSNGSRLGIKQQQGIAVLWAREKIAAIMNSAHHGIVNDKQKSQIIKTALDHHLVSRFTSLVAVDKTPSRIGQELISQKVSTHLPKGSGVSKPATTSLQYSSTSLDLDITARWSLYFLIGSFICFIAYRRAG